MDMPDIEVALRGAMQHIGMEVPADKRGWPLQAGGGPTVPSSCINCPKD